MKQTHSQSFTLPARLSLAAACALALGATALAQSTGASSSPSSTSTNTDRYGSGSGTSSGTHHNTSDTSNTYSNGTTGSSTTGSTSNYGSSSSDMSSTSHGKDKLSWGDRRFVTKAADDGSDEIALAKLATEKASNPEVRSFAQKLIDDHEQVASELSSIASSKNVKIDKDNDHDRTYKRLSKKSGTDFDREFVEHMIDEHEKDIKMFEKAAKDAKDSDVRSFAAKHVDHLRSHLQSAENLRQTIMPTGRTNDHSGRSTSSSSTGSSDTSGSTYGTGSSTSTAPSSSSTSSTSATDKTGK